MQIKQNVVTMSVDELRALVHCDDGTRERFRQVLAEYNDNRTRHWIRQGDSFRSGRTTTSKADAEQARLEGFREVDEKTYREFLRNVDSRG